MAVQDWTEPNVCIAEDLTTDDVGLLRMEKFAVPEVVRDVKVLSGADGKLFPQISLPGKLLMNQKVQWRNTTPLPQMVLIRVQRSYKAIVTSNPNAIQFRDRWTWTIDDKDITPEEPVTTSLYNSQCGVAADMGTNSVAEPNPGVMTVWLDPTCSDEWVGPVLPMQVFNLWYREYVWTPPPWSDNANKNKPKHSASAYWSRIMLWRYPMQPELVTG